MKQLPGRPDSQVQRTGRTRRSCRWRAPPPHAPGAAPDPRPGARLHSVPGAHAWGAPHLTGHTASSTAGARTPDPAAPSAPPRPPLHALAAPCPDGDHPLSSHPSTPGRSSPQTSTPTALLKPPRPTRGSQLGKEGLRLTAVPRRPRQPGLSHLSPSTHTHPHSGSAWHRPRVPHRPPRRSTSSGADPAAGRTGKLGSGPGGRGPGAGRACRRA